MSLKNTAAIIMAAGVGSRFLPATKSVNKCMVPLGNKPVIQYLVEECLEAGIEDIVIVIPHGESIIPDHFLDDPELRRGLNDTGKPDFYDERIAPVVAMGEKITFCPLKYEDKRGTAIPVQEAMGYIDEHVQQVLILNGDAIIARQGTIIGELKAAIESRENESDGILFGFEVPLEQRSSYGVLMQRDDSPRYASTIIEKPAPDVSPESRTCNVGWYLVPRSIEQHLEAIQPDPKSGEYFVTEAVNAVLEDANCLIHKIEGRYLDCGRPDVWLEANNLIASFQK